MTCGFLLRFLESPRPEARDDDINAATRWRKTTMRDNQTNALIAGTNTVTEVKPEQADQDPTTQSAYTLPK